MTKYVYMVGCFLFLALWAMTPNHWFLTGSLVFLMAMLFDYDVEKLHRKVNKNDQ